MTPVLMDKFCLNCLLRVLSKQCLGYAQFWSVTKNVHCCCPNHIRGWAGLLWIIITGHQWQDWMSLVWSAVEMQYKDSRSPEKKLRAQNICRNLTLEGPCIIFCNMYTFQRDTQCSSTDCLLMLRCQLYMFRTVTVHPQELLFVRCCMCRLWYVLIRPAGTYQHIPYSAYTVSTKEAPEDGPLRSETCRADTWVLINNQCNYIVYLVGMYIYCKKWYTDLPMSRMLYISPRVQVGRTFISWSVIFEELQKDANLISYIQEPQNIKMLTENHTQGLRRLPH